LRARNRSWAACSRRKITRKSAATARPRTSWDTALSAQIAEFEAGGEKKNDYVRAIHDRRLARVQRMHGLLLRTLPKRAQDAKGSWLGELQMRQLRAERNHAAGGQKNDHDYGVLAHTLSQQRAALDGLTAQAVKAFSGYSAFAQTLVETTGQAQDIELPEDFLGDLQARINAASEQLAKFRALPLPRLFSVMPLPVGIVLALLLGGAVVFARGFSPPLYVAGAITGALLLAACIGAYVAGASAKDEAARTGAAILDAFRALRACNALADARHRAERKRLQAEYDATFADIEAKWAVADSVESDFEKKGRRKLEPQLQRLVKKIGDRLRRQLAGIRARTDEKVKAFESGLAEQRQQIDASHQAAMTEILANEKARWDKLDAAWKTAITPLWDEITALNSALAPDFPEWSEAMVAAWEPRVKFTPATKFAQLTLDLAKREGSSTAVSRLALPGPPLVSIPLALTYPQQGSLLFETKESCGGATMSVLNNVILRLLTTTPGKVSFTIIDPVGLGQNFAGLMHLADYEEALINRRIWTQRDQIEERLAELNEHIEKVIQMYLRNEYETITAIQ
jgi:S-DNA-T family DNA segregation ATPase FtsK/SpoIIIE